MGFDITIEIGPHLRNIAEVAIILASMSSTAAMVIAFLMIWNFMSK